MANKNKKKKHKGIAKVCKVRPGGTIKIGKPGSRHTKNHFRLGLIYFINQIWFC